MHRPVAKDCPWLSTERSCSAQPSEKITQPQFIQSKWNIFMNFKEKI